MPHSRPPGRPPVRMAGSAQNAITPKEIVSILRRHILLIVMATILGLGVGGVSWYLCLKYYPKYTAVAYIKVLPPVQQDITIISNPVVQKELQYQNRVSLATLITGQKMLQDLLLRDKIRQTRWFNSFGQINDIRLRKAIKDLKENFRASPQRDGDYIVLSMTASSKEESALIVNEMMDLFLITQGENKRDEMTKRLTQLREQRQKVERELQNAEDSLDEVRQAYNFTDLEEREFRDTLTLKLDDLEVQLNELTLEIGQIQSSIKNLERQAQGPVNVQVENQIESDPIMVSLAQRLAILETELSARLTKFGENHRVVRTLAQQIDETKERRKVRKTEIAEITRQANLRNAQDVLTTLISRLEELERVYGETAQRKRDMDLARVQYNQIVKIRDERRSVLNTIKGAIEKYEMVLGDSQASKVLSMGKAPKPLEVSFPSKMVFIPGGMMLGMVLGVGLAFLIELLNDLVRTPRDITKYLHIPLLAVVPDAQEDHQVDDIDLYHVVRQAPYSILSESYRGARTNLKLADAQTPLKSILVTSGLGAEGKTSVAVNLAFALATEDHRILIIDANFWQPKIHTLFPKPHSAQKESSGFGLSNYLIGQCETDKVIRPSGIEGMDVVDTGPLPPNPAELLASQKMDRFLTAQKDAYDYVIIDGPPVLLVSDAKELAKAVDGTVLVFNAKLTKRGVAQRTIRELKQVKAPLIGCVLLAARALKGGYFQQQYRSFQEYQKLQLARSI